MENLSMMNVLVILAVAAVFIPLARWVWLKSAAAQREADATEQAERDKEETSRTRQQVSRGTHDEQGKRLCITCQDKMTRATQPAFVVAQSEGFWDLVRRRFGAPARYIVQQLKRGVNVYCDQCAPLVHLEHEHYILRYENKLREGRRDAAVELRRWLRVGVNELVSQRIDNLEEKSRAEMPEDRRPAPVIPLEKQNEG